MEIDVRLGRRRATGVAPSLFVWVERGVRMRPRVAASIRGEVVFRFAEEGISPLRLGVPNPARLRGLAAILRLSRGRVTIEGDRGLALRLIRLLAL